MRVLLNTYPVAFDCPGGGEIQLLRTRAALQRADVDAILYDQWRPQFAETDVVHHFSVQGGSRHFCDYAKQKHLPLVISPIIWLTEDNLEHFPLDEIRHLLTLCDLVLPNSEMEVAQLAEFFSLDPHKFVVTRNGIDHSFGRRISGNVFREHFNMEQAFLLNVANIEQRKNQLRLIQAVRKLGVKLVLVGGIRDQAYFNQCMEAGAGFVRHLGYIDHDSDLLKSAYSACQAFVLPSILETPGLAALEAAAAGAKLVVTAEGSTSEYFADMVRYVDPYSLEDIRSAIEGSLADSSDDSRLAEHVLSNFTWDHTAQQVIAAYKRVLN